MKKVYSTNNFLYSLLLEGGVDGYSIDYLDREGSIKSVKIKDLRMEPNSISGRFVFFDDSIERIPFFRIKRIFDSSGELVWDASEIENSDVKVIDGF